MSFSDHSVNLLQPTGAFQQLRQLQRYAQLQQQQNLLLRQSQESRQRPPQQAASRGGAANAAAATRPGGWGPRDALQIRPATTSAVPSGEPTYTLPAPRRPQEPPPSRTGYRLQPAAARMRADSKGRAVLR